MKLSIAITIVLCSLVSADQTNDRALEGGSKGGNGGKGWNVRDLEGGGYGGKGGKSGYWSGDDHDDWNSKQSKSWKAYYGDDDDDDEHGHGHGHGPKTRDLGGYGGYGGKGGKAGYWSGDDSKSGKSGKGYYGGKGGYHTRF